MQRLNYSIYSFCSLFLILFFVTSCGNQSKESTTGTGTVISIKDGDTYDILMADNTTLRVRMAAIDAPERGMPYYNVSKNYLKKLCLKKNIRLEITDQDKNGRTVAFSYLEDGTELSHEMLKAGLAWHYKQFSEDEDLAELEDEARKARMGLWKDDNPMPPWDNRRYHKQGVSTKDSFEVVAGGE